ncbi:hypothetical protein LX36DRAFT_752525, partial [Colletotrichum falcatum]
RGCRGRLGFEISCCGVKLRKQFAKRSQSSFGAGSFPSPPEPKRPRYDRSEPEQDIGLASDVNDSVGHSSAEEEQNDALVQRLVAKYKRKSDLGLLKNPKPKKYYAVWRGRECGIFLDWADCKKQTDGYSKAG